MGAIVSLVRHKVEFVSYDGKYPNLCRGVLVLRVDGVEVRFPKYFLNSGGEVSWGNDGDRVWEGEYFIYDDTTWPEGVPKSARKQVLEVINNNIPWGCCGGCI